MREIIINQQIRERYGARVDNWLNRPDTDKPEHPDKFRERVLGIFAYSEYRERNNRNCADAYGKALQRVEKAILELEALHNNDYGNDQTQHLLKQLQAARIESGEIEKKETAKISAIYFDDYLSAQWISSSLTERKKKVRREQARLIFELEALWCREFNERPANHIHHSFFVFAGTMLGISPEGVKKQRERIVPPDK
jgi:CRISPR/Cas system CMR subunit Cmr4 (Cas7 group RAMP superfamily)